MKGLLTTEGLWRALTRGKGLFLIAGPCVIESPRHPHAVAARVKAITARLGVPYVFKASYDKANRSSLGSYRGPGVASGLEILAAVRERHQVPILTDVHEVAQVEAAARVADVLQIPAFLCRQTDLVLAAAATGKIVNVKKGQFMAPWDMKGVLDKAASTGNPRIMVTERGFSFGYNNLVVDMRSFPTLRSFGYPVVFDVTHSVQRPGGLWATAPVARRTSSTPWGRPGWPRGSMASSWRSTRTRRGPSPTGPTPTASLAWSGS